MIERCAFNSPFKHGEAGTCMSPAKYSVTNFDGSDGETFSCMMHLERAVRENSDQYGYAVVQIIGS